jgi:DNA-directed RNA polymerase specialized sigma subunit
MAKHALDFIRRIVLGITRRYPYFVDRDDLIGAGAGALAYVQAQQRFKPERGVFEHYVTIKIRGAVLDTMRRQDPRAGSRRKRQDDPLVISNDSSLFNSRFCSSSDTGVSPATVQLTERGIAGRRSQSPPRQQR